MAGGEGVDNGGVENPTMVVESRERVLSAFATAGVPTADHFKLRSGKLSLDLHSIPEDHVAVELLWFPLTPIFGEE